MKLDIETLNRLEKYFNEEVESYMTNTRLENNEGVAFKNVAQALFWGSAIFEFHRKNDHAFLEWYQKDESFSVISGFIYARHRVAHQFLQLLYISEGAEFPMQLPAPFFEIRWLPLENLPAPDKKHEHKKKADEYKKSFENKPVRFTLEDLKSFFTSARNRLETLN